MTWTRSLERVRRRLRQESGFTLIELLVAASLMMVVLTATLNAMDRTASIQRKTEKSNDAQETVRVALDRIAQQLRNLASPTSSTVKTIDAATSYDLIFQTTDPNKQWVRYCLADGTNDPSTFSGFAASTAARERIWYQTPNSTFLALSPQKLPSQVAGMTGTCPAAPAAAGTAGWATAKVVASRITNKNGADRPLFTTNQSGTDTSSITNIRTDMYGQFGTGLNDPRETRISTGVYLRNQNQAPTANIQYTRGTGANIRSYQLNGTLSSDPEQRTMTSFLWYKGTPATAVATTAKLPGCATPTDQTKTTGSSETWTCIGSGAILNYPFPLSDGDSIAVALLVTDPGNLTGIATANSLPLSAPTP
jgi:type II secretory pathway pseudopilin PulG